MIVFSQKFNRHVMVISFVVVPRSAVDAGVGEVLVGLLRQQFQEGHLDDPDSFVSYLERRRQNGYTSCM